MTLLVVDDLMSFLRTTLIKPRVDYIKYNIMRFRFIIIAIDQ